jgi:PAS domain S-box-containing protein
MNDHDTRPPDLAGPGGSARLHDRGPALPGDRYRRLVENSLGLICAHDLDGTLLFVNAAAAQALGYQPDEGVGRNLREFLAPGTRHLFDEYLDRIRNQQVDEGLMRVVDRFGRERVWMYRNVRSEDPGERPFVVGHGLDITERVAAERSLRASEQAVKLALQELQASILRRTEELLEVNKWFSTEISRQYEPGQRQPAADEVGAAFALLADAAPVMLWMSGPERLCTFCNRVWLDFTGRSIESELGMGWATAVHPADASRCLDTYTQAFHRRKPFRMEYRLRRHDGEFRWVLTAGVPRIAGNGAFAGYICSAVDITEHKLSHDVLQGLSRRLIEAQESERSWIARELREDLAQRTVALVMQLQALARELPGGAGHHALVLAMCDQAADLGRDIEAISRRLQSSRLEYLGLASAAAGLCNELSEQQGVKIAFTDDRLPEDLPKDVGLALFRVLREALANAVTHAGVRHITVALRAEPGEITLEVMDAGIGFDLEAARQSGFGLISMQERLHLVGGSLTVDSRPGAGTTVRARVPLGRRQQNSTSRS